MSKKLQIKIIIQNTIKKIAGPDEAKALKHQTHIAVKMQDKQDTVHEGKKTLKEYRLIESHPLTLLPQFLPPPPPPLLLPLPPNHPNALSYQLAPPELII